MKVAGLMAGAPPNSVHKAFFESACSSITPLGLPAPGSRLYQAKRMVHLLANFRRKELDSADVALSESIYEYPALHKRLFRKNLKIIELFASPKIFKVLNGEADPLSSALMKSLIREVDAFLPVSQMCADFLREKGIDKPAEVVHPFVSDAKYASLSKAAYDSGSKTIICVGNPPEYKGMDFLLKAFDALCSRGHDLRLRLVTKGVARKHLEGIKNLDKVAISPIAGDSAFCDALSSSLLSVHFGRYDTFPVSTLEAMLGGVPTFVSAWTGTKELAEKADGRFVLPFDVEKSADEIERFLSLSEGTKLAYSKKFRELALPFSRKEQVALFKEKFDSLVSRLS
ncbi:MAG: glycosyltransferase family 4 protein [Candidatus Micrarchaeota archaeon]